MAEYYVSLSGDNGNAGTEESPWRTIVYGIGQCSSGDTLWVLATSDSYEYGNDFPTIPAGVTVRGKGTIFPYIHKLTSPGLQFNMEGTLINFRVSGETGYNHPIMIQGRDTGKIYNSLIYGRDITSGSYDCGLLGGITIYNSVVIGERIGSNLGILNTYDSELSKAYNCIFMREGENSLDIGRNFSLRTVTTDNCSKYDNVSNGVGTHTNLITENTEFIGDNYILPADSALIDAGYGSGAEWDDPADGDAAKAPSRGTTQNDIGLYGGPYAFDLFMIESPSDTSAATLNNATFTAGIAYNSTAQWQVNKGYGWEDIDGETDTTLIFEATMRMSGWQYRCVFTNDFGDIYSDAATLTVTFTPSDARAYYCTPDDVISYLPASYDEGVSDSYLLNAIAQASSECDARVGRNFSLNYQENKQRFPNITDSPATPELIREAAALLAAYRVYVKLREVNRGLGDDPQGIILRNSGRKILEEIRNGEIDILIGGTMLGQRNLVNYPTDGSVATFRQAKYSSHGVLIEEGSFKGY